MSQPSIQASGRTSAAAGPTRLSESVRVQQYLTFLLGADVFAIGILAIKEIIEYTDPTAVPMSPQYVRGVINLRGAVVPVLDLCVRFGKPLSPVTKRTCIVIIEVEAGLGRYVVGVVVDTVNAVLDIPATEIEPPPSFGMHIRSDLVQGMGKVAGRFVVLLNVNRVLAADELEALADTRESAAAS